jgi:hypothetical protein
MMMVEESVRIWRKKEEEGERGHRKGFGGSDQCTL